VAARADRDERNFNREIRSEQEAAFAETLRQDQERENQRLEEERREEERRQQELQLVEEERRRLAAEEEKRERVRRLKIDLLDEIPAEPDTGCLEAIRILIKLPGGQRLERR
jgi:FAS-associated factor 2